MPSGSKTSLGSLVYTLDNLPTFYVVEIQTLNKDDEQCLSRKLRCSAIEDFLTKKNFLGPWAVNHNAKKNQLDPETLRNAVNTGPIDHLILRCNSKGDLKPQVLQATDNDDGIIFPDKEIRRNSEGKLESRPIRCRFMKGRIVSPSFDPGNETERKLYTRCLDTFICTMVNNKPHAVRKTGINPASKDWKLVNETSFDPILKKTGLRKYCSVSTHASPLLKLELKELHLGLDLAFCLDKSVKVTALLFEYLGNSVLGPISAEQLSLIKGVLVGQEVKYTDPEKATKGEKGERSNKGEKGENSNTFSMISRFDPLKLSIEGPPATPRGRVVEKRISSLSLHSPAYQRRPLSALENLQSPEGRMEDNEDQVITQVSANTPSFTFYRVQDIRSSAEVSRFVSHRREANNAAKLFSDEKARPISVAAYFDRVKGSKLKFPHLPLAKVGRDTWIPLEFLELSQGQILRKTGHLTDFVDLADSDATEQNDYHKGRFARIDREEHLYLNEGARQLPPIFKPGPLNYFPPTKAHTDTARKEPDLDANAHLIYIPSDSSYNEENDNFLQLVANGLHQASNSPVSTVTFSEVDTTLIEVEKPLVLRDLEIEPRDVLIGIVDKSGRIKADVDQIRAEIHRYAEQVVGCVAVCISKHELERSFFKNASTEGEINPESSYFPNGLLQKINLMLGGTNYKSALESKPLEAVATEMRNTTEDGSAHASDADSVSSAMIFGAHVSHPGSGAGVSCPSVAAIVSSGDSTVHYFGAARVQPTMRQTTERKGHGRNKPGIKHIMQSRILGLKSMVQERLPQNVVNPSVIFFRHGLDPKSEEDVIGKEMADIKTAFESDRIKRDQVKLTYIVVNHNNRTVTRDELVGLSGFAVEAVDKPKYWYSVQSNDLGIPENLLKDLVCTDG